MRRPAVAGSPLPRAALAQALAALLVFGLAPVLDLPRLGPLLLAGSVGGIAALLTLPLGLPRWWLPLQLLFAPALVLASRLELPPLAWGGAFLLTLLLLGNSLRDRVPLYLSSGQVWRRVAALLPEAGSPRFADLGCGTGAGLAAVSGARPEAVCVGVETSPLLWLLCRLRLAARRRCRALLLSLWRLDLGDFDLVYAFLSPAPMPALWSKARDEMRPGSLLVSNSFPVPEVEPTEVIEVADRRHSRLYVYRM